MTQFSISKIHFSFCEKNTNENSSGRHNLPYFSFFPHFHFLNVSNVLIRAPSNKQTTHFSVLDLNHIVAWPVNQIELNPYFPKNKSFKNHKQLQLLLFDSAWCLFLCHFQSLLWHVKAIEIVIGKLFSLFFCICIFFVFFVVFVFRLNLHLPRTMSSKPLTRRNKNENEKKQNFRIRIWDKEHAN